MEKIKIVAVDKFEKMEYTSTGFKEYDMFYNEMVRKNNVLYEMYIQIEVNINHYEKKKESLINICDLIRRVQELQGDKSIKKEYEFYIIENDKLTDILRGLYKTKDYLFEMHISISNAINQLAKK